MSIYRPANARLKTIIRKFPRVRLLVVGDLMLDEFIWGKVDRISPEAPVPVVRVTHESFHLGGAANVVHNIRALGGAAAVCGIVGDDAAGRRVLSELKKIGAGTDGVISNRGAVTIRKTRVIAHSQQVVRFDREQRDLPHVGLRKMAEYLERHLWDFDAVILSDYGKGVINASLLALFGKLHERRPFRLIVDPKKPNFGHYRGITLATPNQAEAAEATGVEIRDDSSLREAGRNLIERWDADSILITRGENGMTLIPRSGALRHFPTVARQVFDVTGAGDTVVATCGLAHGAGAALDEAVYLANHAAGIVVGKVGTATVSATELAADVIAGE